MKLHLPKLLLTAVLAVIAMPSALQAATYSVTMGPVGGDGNYYIHNSTYTDESTGTAASGYTAVVVGTNDSGTEHILHFTSTSGTVENAELKVEYTNFGIAGVDVDADTNVAKIGYKNGPRNFHIGKKGVTSASTVDRDFAFETNGKINLYGTQTWTVAAGKTFTFTGSSIVNNGDITISGNGSVDFSSKSVSGIGSIAVNGTLKNATFGSGSTIGLNSGATLVNVSLSDGSFVATTFEWGATSGKQTVSKTWDLSSATGFTAGTSVGLNIGGVRIAGTSSFENSTLTISTDVYNVAAADTVSIDDISGVSGIAVNGTLTGVADATLPSSTYVGGPGTVQVNGKLENKLDALVDFTGTVELVNEGKIHFGNNQSKLPNIDKIKINSGAYITGWGATFDHDILLNGGNLAVYGGSWTGDLELTADSSIGMYRGSTISGAITATAGTTLTVKKETVIGEGQAETITFNGTAGKLSGATLDIQYGTVKIQGRDEGTGMIAGAIKVGAGAKLQVVGGDTLGYAGGDYTDSITAAGSKDNLAVIQLDASQTMSANLYLNGYTEINGSSFNSFGESNEVEDGTIVSASGTNNTIKSNFNLRRHVTFTVAESGSLTMEGTLTDTAGFNGSLIKEGKGALNFTGTLNSSREFTVKEGAINLSGATNSMGTLDLSVADSSDAVLTVKKDAVLTVGTLWGCSTSSLLLEEGATLKLSSGVINIKGTGSTSGISATDNVSYSHDQEAMCFNNSEVTVNSGDAITLGNVFAGSSLINANGGKVTLTNEDNNLKSIDAKSGNIVVNNYNAGKKQGTLDSLNIGDGKSVSVYTGETASEAAEGTLTTNALTAGTGSTLNANLVLSDGATVKLAAALTMGSTVTLGEGMTLSGNLVSTIQGLGEGETTNLFTGVDELYLGGSTTASGILTEADAVTLGTYFTGFDDTYYLGYDGQNVFAGVKSPVTPPPAVPEPTTATLSLLALAALASRRRRR